MTAHRSRKQELEYAAHRQSVDKTVCEFCKPPSEQVVKTTRNFRVIHNKFPYSIWDGLGAVDHLMVVPKKHTDTIVGFTDSMALEYFHILEEYEAKGYNVYARAPASKKKSIIHQHTHLIKTEGEEKNIVFMVRKPYYFRFIKS
jgi:diadenosine tetraphosphate (Ap4A) HIT family hydrolase